MLVPRKGMCRRKRIRMSSKRNIALDITKIVAVLAVVMIHVGGIFVSSYERGSAEFMWGNIMDSISRIGVPMFVMASGALMLDENKNVSMKKLLSHNVSNIFLLALFWCAFYAVCFEIVIPHMRGEAVVLQDAFFTFINGYYHLWYLFMVIGLYLITPFIRSFVRKENKRLVEVFLCIALATQFTIPVLREIQTSWEPVNYIIRYIGKFYLGFFGGYTAYYVLGWYIVHVGIQKKHLLCLLGALSLAATIVYVQMTGDYDNGYSNYNLFVALYSAAVFMLINRKPVVKVSERTEKIIVSLSKLTFGVYIIHPLYTEPLKRVLVYKGIFIGIFVFFALVTVLAFVTCLVGSKVPGIRKLFRN